MSLFPSSITMKLLLLLAAFLPLALSEEQPERPQQFRSSYIIGGKEAKVGAWPWQASLQRYTNHMCGASLISSRWLVTAAHCVGYSTSDYTVVLGMHDQKRQMASPENYRISRVVKHPAYESDGRGYPNDIALMYLSEEANTDNPYIKSVTMASASDTFLNSMCRITGWGKSSFGFPDRLQEAQVSVYHPDFCKSIWEGAIGDYHVCVGNYGKQGACNGDSGGPLVCDKDGQWMLVGATSFSAATCSTYLPSVYSSVPYFRDWIQSVTNI